MSFLVFHVLTVVLSIMMKKGMDFNFLRRIGNLGYKVNLEENANLVNNIKSLVRDIKNDNNEALDRFILLLPGINMIDCIYEAKIYSDIIEEVIDKTKEVNAIVKMNDEEKDIFMQRPTGFTAWAMLTKEYVERCSIRKVIIKDTNEEIYYTCADFEINYDEKNNVSTICIINLKIINTKRKNKILTDEDCKKIVTFTLLNFIEEVTDNKTFEELEKIDILAMLQEGIIFDKEKLNKVTKEQEFKIEVSLNKKDKNRNKYTATLSPKKEKIINESNHEVITDEINGEDKQNTLNNITDNKTNLDVTNEEKDIENKNIKKLVRRKENDNKKDK